MLSADQNLTSILFPREPKLLAVLAVQRPRADGLLGIGKGIGVAATVRGQAGLSHYWMAGYARSEDMGYAAMIKHILDTYRGHADQIEVWSPSPIATLQYVSAARLRGGRGKDGRFKAFDIFDPVEAALKRGEWRLRTFNPSQELPDIGNAPGLAKRALQVASDRVHDFSDHLQQHPDWWMLEVGSTDQPGTERVPMA